LGVVFYDLRLIVLVRSLKQSDFFPRHKDRGGRNQPGLGVFDPQYQGVFEFRERSFRGHGILQWWKCGPTANLVIEQLSPTVNRVIAGIAGNGVKMVLAILMP
jgi:hypothetical protein